MKQIIHFVLLLVLGVSLSVTKGQIIESFDTDISADPTYDLNVEGALSRIDYTLNTTDIKEGTGSGHVNFVIGAYHEWGSYAQLIKRVPDGEPLLDWSISDSLSIWIKVLDAPEFPQYMVFRIQIADRPTETDAIEEYIYEHATVLDVVGDWYELKLPLFEREQPGTEIPNDQGFILAPTSWGGFGYNNRRLDFDKIVGYNISAITSGYTAGVNLPADSVVVMLDGFQRYGIKSVPAIIFNGVAVPSRLSAFNWGGPAAEIIVGAGASAGHNAIKWTQGDTWCGFGWNIDPPFQLAGAWPVDSLQFKMKVEEGVGDIRAQFEATGGKKGLIFTPIADNAWHSYKFALNDFVYKDNTTGFDSAQVGVFQFMAEGNAVNGKVIYFDDIWTGNPEFDVIAPSAPLNVTAFDGGISNPYQNVITWDDVPGETGETYSVYYSANPISDIANAEVVKLNILENNGLATHVLLAPITNQSTTYYYAVVCKDASGNQSELSNNSPAVTNTAKGVTTISLNAPVFVADGDLSEWQSIPEFRMFLSEGNGHRVTNTTITNDADCSAKAWVAVDATYLYVAFEVFDDIFVPNAQPESYLNDSPDLYIGLYNWHGAPHIAYKRGVEPDYHFRFAYNRALLDNLGSATVDTLGENYYFGEAFGSGYRVEFRISWVDLAVVGNDNVFVPVEGYRIPIDFSINDADATNSREGILTYSINNEDQSWGDVSRWTYTWIGALWNPVGVEYEEGQPVSEYALTQNYPNPFNPSTQISFALKEAGYVTLKVYDALGKEVATLIKGDYTSGSYNVSFDASGLASGIYFYRLETGSFVQTNKMMLLK
jgi:hypothetical protein